ncbi:hypothetical protein ACVWWN_002680 [Mycobacterium sp. URHB0021]
MATMVSRVLLRPMGVAVPGHAVLAVAVQAQARGGERFAEFTAVGVVEATTDLLEPRMRHRLVDEVVEADQPRDVDHAVIHLPALGAPRNALAQLVEQ